MHGTGGGSRTLKVLLPPDFESSASANSATPASVRGKMVAHLVNNCKLFLRDRHIFIILGAILRFYDVFFT